ncbi:hypothetical protein B0H12DRAFT_1235254 [Mycena haematopus]|nr:hypothetical protein B0H12DRAFT_1235254 [Mycena haematopus]
MCGGIVGDHGGESQAVIKRTFDPLTLVPRSMATVSLLPLLYELLALFCASSLIVLALLRIYVAQAPVPLVETLKVTFVCTLVVLAAMRGAGYLWRSNHRELVDGAETEVVEGSDSVAVTSGKKCVHDDLA